MFSTAGSRERLVGEEQEIWIGELAPPGFFLSTLMTALLEDSVEHSLVSPVRGMVVKKSLNQTDFSPFQEGTTKRM